MGLTKERRKEIEAAFEAWKTTAFLTRLADRKPGELILYGSYETAAVIGDLLAALVEVERERDELKETLEDMWPRTNLS